VEAGVYAEVVTKGQEQQSSSGTKLERNI
jgi:hypothetical protein